MDFKNQRSHELYYLLISWLEFYIMQSCIKPYVIFCKLCNSYFVLDISIYLSLPIILCTHHQHSQFRRVPLQSSTPSQSQLSILVEYGSWHQWKCNLSGFFISTVWLLHLAWTNKINPVFNYVLTNTHNRQRILIQHVRYNQYQPRQMPQWKNTKSRRVAGTTPQYHNKPQSEHQTI